MTQFAHLYHPFMDISHYNYNIIITTYIPYDRMNLLLHNIIKRNIDNRDIERSTIPIRLVLSEI